MQMKDATRIFGRVGVFIPLILLFLTAADSAIACPGHKTKAAYRTSAINRTVSNMPTTVISYRAPASYRRCGANLYDTRGARYVAVHRNGSSARYVAVRNEAPRTTYIAVRNHAPRTRYVAVRNVDLDDDDLRYVAVRRDVRRPEAGMRTIAVRSGYRKGNGIVAYIDNEPRYAVVRRVVPRTRYVAVRDIDIDDDERYMAVRRVVPRTRYVAVRNIDTGCTRAVALRRCLDDVETTSVRRVVLRDDDDVAVRNVVLRDDIDEEEIVENEIDSDDEYIAVASETPAEVEYTDAAYSNLKNDKIYIAANDFDSPCARTVAVRTCRPEVLSTRTISYEVSDDDDWDDQAFLHEDGATYVAAGNVGDACVSRQVVYTSPEVDTTRAVRYIPAALVSEDSTILESEPLSVVTEDADLMVGEPTHLVTEDASLIVGEPASFITEQVVTSQPRWVALDEDETFNDLDPTWVAEVEATAGPGTVSYVPGGDVEVSGTAVSWVPVDDFDDSEIRTASYVPIDDVEEADIEAISAVPVDDLEEIDAQTVSYMPAAEHVDTTMVSYVPVDDTVETVHYMPVSDLEDDRTTYIADNACPMYVADSSAVLVEELDGELLAGLRGTQQIASGFGYRDGFEDGQEAALEGDLYHPENSGDYEKATEGYEDEFGNKDVYKGAYRSSYLDGYRAGFETGSSV